jgi:hypothetical protein
VTQPLAAGDRIAQAMPFYLSAAPGNHPMFLAKWAHAWYE